MLTSSYFLLFIGNSESQKSKLEIITDQQKLVIDNDMLTSSYFLLIRVTQLESQKSKLEFITDQQKLVIDNDVLTSSYFLFILGDSVREPEVKVRDYNRPTEACH